MINTKLLLVLCFLTFGSLGQSLSECHNPWSWKEVISNPSLSFVFNGKPIHLDCPLASDGDLNGDGYNDLVFSSGDIPELYVVFGRNSTEWETSFFDFSTSTPPNTKSWIKITGIDVKHIGFSALTIKNFNNDTFDDLIFGSDNSTAFIIYGHSNPWQSFTTDDIWNDVVPGFVITVKDIESQTYVGSAGDLNADGIEDMLVSEFANNNGQSWIIFGELGPERDDINVSELDGSNGFKIVIAEQNYWSGYAIYSDAGDINGDGWRDLVVGVTHNSPGYAVVIFANNYTNFDPIFNVTSDINGENGFIVTQFGGWTATGAGDLNDDGFDDLLFGSDTDTGAFVVFGHGGNWSESPLDLTTLNGHNGFHFTGRTTDLRWGITGDSAGDFNNDGYDDLILGSNHAYNFANTIKTGAALIIFGHPDPWKAVITRDEVIGDVGFQIDGHNSSSQFGLSTFGVGDVNGDGISDVALSSFGDYSVVILFGISRGSCSCNIDYNCSLCDPGFGLYKSLGKCIDCTTYNGFSIYGNGTCNSCNQNNNCSHCVSTTGECTLCSIGFELNATGDCLACDAGQYNYPIGLSCIDCSVDSDCLKCNVSDGNCAQCTAGYEPYGFGCRICNQTTFSDGTQPCRICFHTSYGDCNCSSTTGECYSCPDGLVLSPMHECIPQSIFSQLSASSESAEISGSDSGTWLTPLILYVGIAVIVIIVLVISSAIIILVCCLKNKKKSKESLFEPNESATSASEIALLSTTLSTSITTNNNPTPIAPPPILSIPPSLIPPPSVATPPLVAVQPPTDNIPPPSDNIPPPANNFSQPPPSNDFSQPPPANDFSQPPPTNNFSQPPPENDKTNAPELPPEDNVIDYMESTAAPALPVDDSAQSESTIPPPLPPE